MISIYEAHRQSEQKRCGKFCSQKTAKKRKTHPKKPEKGKTGCVLGAGGDENGCEQGRTDVKTQSPNQSEPHSHTTRAKRKPAKTQCFRRFCGRGRRTWSRLPPRSVRGRAPLALAHPTTRTAQGAAVPRCQILPHTNEKVRCRRSDT